MTVDRVAWARALTTHYKSKYFDGADTKEAQQLQMHQLRDLQTQGESASTPTPELAMSILIEAWRQLKTNSSGGGDEVVTEHIKILPWSILCRILLLFQHSYRGIASDTASSWKE